MTWIPPLCVVVAIGAVLPWFLLAEQHRNRKADAIAVPSNVTRLDSRRKAGENVTVLRSVK